MSFKLLPQKYIYILAETLFGFAIITSLYSLLGEPDAVKALLFPFCVSLVLNLLIESKPIITFFSILLAIGFFTFGFFYFKFDIIIVLLIILSFLSVCWTVLWRQRRWGLGAIALVLLIITAVPYFMSVENETAVLAGIFSVLLFALVFVPSKSKSAKKAAGVKGSILPFIAITAVLALVASAPTSIVEDYPKNKEINRIISNLNVYKKISYSAPDYNISNSGFSLGGPVKLSSMVVYTAKADFRTKLRASIYTEYTGSSWQKSASGILNYPLSKVLYTGDFNRIFNINLPKASNLPSEFWQDYEITLTPFIIMQSLPVPFRFKDISLNQDNMLIMYNSNGEVFASDPVRVSYTIKGRIPNTESSAFNQWMDKNADSFPESGKDIRDIYDTYCQLPEALPPEVYSDAAYAMGDGNRYQRAKRLEQWLATTKTYTLDPNDDFFNYSDFVQMFLSTNEGYCTYFASAMTVMLRTQGIPARYVTGFAMPVKQEENGTYLIRENCAHAWCEVYFEGIGWIPFEPTASGSVADTDLTGSGFVYTPPLTDPTRPDPSNPKPTQPPSNKPTIPKPAVTNPAKTISRPTLSGAICCLLLLLVLYILVVAMRLFAAGKVYEKPIEAWLKLEKPLARLGLKRKADEPLSAFAERAESTEPFRELGIAAAAAEAEHCTFSPEDAKCEATLEALNKAMLLQGEKNPLWLCVYKCEEWLRRAVRWVLMERF
ncbi:MAG: transglutaminase-like domain-containing protein [Oscillospiraceae bacterium]|nr:transglutaminase-like domain-containing protein [Oscillospiraceae bacterium]